MGSFILSQKKLLTVEMVTLFEQTMIQVIPGQPQDYRI